MTTSPRRELIRGSCVIVEGTAVLFRGESGSGKSDLALRLIDEGATLLSDDYLDIERKNAKLYGMPPERIAGLIEIRGLGIVAVPYAREAELGLAIDLVRQDEVPRLPEIRTVTILGVNLPLYALAPFEASAPAKVRAIVRSQASARPAEPAPFQ